MTNDQYHPSAFNGASSGHVHRRVDRRLDVMRSGYDFTGKHLLDLGCSGGYFSFRLGETAAQVLGIDGDADMIRKNSAEAERRRVTNVRFEHAVLDADYIRSDAIPQVDVTIFLSVLHHIIATSKRYNFNDEAAPGLENGVEILAAIRSKTDVLWFEIGQSEEDMEWAAGMPDMGSAPQDWIVDHLLKPAGFTNIEVFDPPEWSGRQGKLRKLLHTNGQPLVRKSSGTVGRAVRRATRYDTRDCRYMFKASD